MVREWRPPAREPARSGLVRRSTMATSTPANASSPANISPVGPPPAITTACSVIGTLQSAPTARRRGRATHAFRDSHFRGFGLRRQFYGRSRVLKQAPCAPYVWSGYPPFPLSSAVDQQRSEPS